MPETTESTVVSIVDVESESEPVTPNEIWIEDVNVNESQVPPPQTQSATQTQAETETETATETQPEVEIDTKTEETEAVIPIPDERTPKAATQMSLPPPAFNEAPVDGAPYKTNHIHAQPHSHAQPQPRKRRQKKIAVLTSGGDSAGMNAAVRAVVRQGIARGCQAYIIREGWEGLVRGNTVEPTPVASRAASRRASAAPSPAMRPFNGTGLASLSSAASFSLDSEKEAEPYAPNYTDPDNIAPLSDAPLSFGYGSLLRDGAGEGDPEEVAAAFAQHVTLPEEEEDSGRTLKGRYIVRVGWDDVRGWLGEGGTLIGSSRCPSFRTREGRLRAARNLIINGIDCLAVCGGDGSLTGADTLRAEWPGLIEELANTGEIDQDQLEAYRYLNIVGLVGSIDNDMSMTDLTIGAVTALHRICEAVDSISSTASSHSRAFVIEVMGRHCGWLALMAAVATGADFLFIPEQPPASDDWASEMCEVLKHHRLVGKRKSIVIVAEGAIDKNIKPIKADYVKEILVERLGLDTRVTTLGHTQRGGTPAAMDRVLPTLQGVKAVEALLEATPQTPSYMIGIVENKITKIPLLEAVAQTKAVAAAIDERDFAKAMTYRDSEFKDMLAAFEISSSLSAAERAPEDKRLRVGIIHVGAPAGGMNAATRQAVRYCHNRGHTPLGIYNGFEGLLEDNVSELAWLRVDNWTTRGGSELGTNRTLPSIDMGSVAAALQRHSIDALLLIGGFEAFNSVVMLEKARSIYPSLHIPMVHLPATLSNNVPYTDYSLGSDTSLNALVTACDAIKQSASASRNRVFVVETQGGMSGYLAVMGALAVGAVLVYTPEAGISLRRLLDDVEFLKERYALDEQGKSEGRLVIKSEKSSTVYSTEVLTKILKEEGKELFDARSASLGHTLQGGVPAPQDRTRAARMALLSMQFIEKHASPNAQAYHPKKKSPVKTETAAMIAIRGSKIVYPTMEQVLSETDMKLRRGTNVWWSNVKDLVEVMGGRTGLVKQMHCHGQ